MVDRDFIFNYFRSKLNVSEKESLKYLSIHAKRYAFLINLVSEIRAELPDDSIRILDIGPSYLTELLGFHFKNDTIYSMGFSNSEGRGGHFPETVTLDNETFIAYDLNDSQDKGKWIPVPECDIVIMAEVIEHLYTAPQLILDFIQTFLKVNGNLIIQTPNAVSLDKRIRMLSGKNPYDMVNINRLCPGHFREFTKNELFSVAEDAHYSVQNFVYSNYFDLKPVNYKVMGYRLMQFLLGRSFSDGMTIVLKKDTTAQSKK